MDELPNKSLKCDLHYTIYFFVTFGQTLGCLLAMRIAI
jgi:hypothetical protein